MVFVVRLLRELIRGKAMFAAEISSNLVSGIITAVVMGLMIGIFKGIEWLRSKWSAESNALRNQINNHQNWTDVTGEIRPVTSSECKEKHTSLQQDLARGSDKFVSQAETINTIEKAILRMEGDIKVGFASIPNQVNKTVGAALDKHESGPLHGTNGKR